MIGVLTEFCRSRTYDQDPMLQLLLALVWNLCLLLVDRVFWSLLIVIAVGVVFFGIAGRIFAFPDTVDALARVECLPSPPMSPPDLSQNLSVPRARWGKAFSYHSQEIATNSSSDSDPSDAHGQIMRSLQAHEEEQYAITASYERGETGGPGTGSSRSDARRDSDLRRSQWRSKQFHRVEAPRPKLEHKGRNGSLISGEQRPRLQRQETVGGPFVFDVPSPIHSDEQECDHAVLGTPPPIKPDPVESAAQTAVVPSPRWPSSPYSVDNFAEHQPMTSLVPNGNTANSITICGSVEVSFCYDPQLKIMYVTVVQASNLDSIGPAGIQIKVCLMPSKRARFKTKIRHGKNPKFHECYHIRGLPPEEVNSMGVRIRLYVFEKLVSGQLIGECMVAFNSINLDHGTTLTLTLEPRKPPVFDTNSTVSTTGTGELRSLSRSDSTLSAQSMPLSSSSPELLLGLAFNDITGHLKVEIIKGSRFRSPSINRPVDTYVKMSLLSSNRQVLSRAKTSVRRAQPNPIFRENFLFPVALFQLSDVTLVCTIFIRRSMRRKQQIGYLSIGHVNSSEDAATHWRDFQLTRDQVCRWHTLRKPEMSSRNIFA